MTVLIEEHHHSEEEDAIRRPENADEPERGHRPDRGTRQADRVDREAQCSIGLVNLRIDDATDQKRKEQENEEDEGIGKGGFYDRNDEQTQRNARNKKGLQKNP